MDRPKLEVADIFRRYGEAYRQQHGVSLSTAQRRVMTAIEVCRTAALGGHLEHCDSCAYERPCYDSCRDRHCPKCQSLARAEWVEKRKAEILPTPFLFARTGVVLPVPPIVLDLSGGGFRCRQTQVLLFPRGPSRSGGFPPASRFRAQCEMGRLRQSAFRRTPASGGLRRPLHSPGRDFQSSDRGYRRRPGQVQLVRLQRQKSAENYDSFGQEDNLSILAQ